MAFYERIVQSQHLFFQSGKTLSRAFRVDALNKLREAILQNEAKILEALERDLGKAAFEAYASEIGIVLGEIRTAIKLARKFSTPKRVRTPLFLFPSRSRILYEPLGVCLIIAPWNYPFQLAIAPLIAAIAAGNCAVVKPSERSIHTATVISQLLNSLFEPHYVHTIIANPIESQALVDQRFDKLFFTGSSKVGKLIYEQAAKKMVPVTLELGGKNPCIVLGDAHIPTTARRIVWGKFFNAGQTCVAPDYLLVHRSIKEPLVAALQAEIHSQSGSSPNGVSPYYGKLIDTRHGDQLQQLIAGTEVICGGTFDRTSLQFSPTLVDLPDWQHPLMEDEIFGPILPIICFDTVDDILARIRALPKSLALYLFTRNSVISKQIFSALQFGGGCINDTLIHFSSPYLCVGGVGASGVGRYRGADGYRAFSHCKSIVITPVHPELLLRYPPFPSFKLQLLKRLMK